jgi:hypothetical protein
MGYEWKSDDSNLSWQASAANMKNHLQISSDF